MSVTLLLLLVGIGITIGIPTLLIVGYILGRLRPVYRWRLARRPEPVVAQLPGTPRRLLRAAPLIREDADTWPIPRSKNTAG
jgi:hypothetical protein